jgi:very-short-patch-repair endonuclease
LICPRGHDCQISWDNFRTNGVRCGTCNESKGERRVAALLTRAKVFYKRGYSLQKGKSPLRLDFYISTLNLGIEFDGEQHFEPVRFRGIDIERARRIFKKIKKRDRAKNNLCKKLGINLFRIKYTDNIEQVLGKWVKV